MSENVTIVFLHGLGGSARAFDPVAAFLPDGFRVIGVDLPGHGGAAVGDDLSVSAMADRVARRIADEVSGEYLVVAHSMGGKIASMVTARALRGDRPIPTGLVLLAPSPPVPEPMAEERRERMLSWVADGPVAEADAVEFVQQNVGGDLSSDDEEQTVADVRRTSPEAWRSWLEHGSREDVSAQVGSIDVPATILAGTSDEDLGAGAQRGLHSAVYPGADYVDLDGAGHLLTYERPREVAAAIVSLVEDARRG